MVSKGRQNGNQLFGSLPPCLRQPSGSPTSTHPTINGTKLGPKNVRPDMIPNFGVNAGKMVFHDGPHSQAKSWRNTEHNLHLLKRILFIFPPVGFKRNSSLLDTSYHFSLGP